MVMTHLNVYILIIISISIINININPPQEQEFAMKRSMRSNAASPSHGALPTLRSHEDTNYKIVMNSLVHEENFGDVEEYVYDNPIDDDENIAGAASVGIGGLGARTATMTPKSMPEGRNYGSTARKTYKMSIASHKVNVDFKDGDLDMDHHFITFGQYLYTQLLVGPNALALWITGAVTLMFRDRLARWGLIEPKVVDYPTLVGKLCLESAFSIHYQGKKKDENNGHTIAGFFVSDFPGVLQDGSFKIFDLLSVEIDLDTKRMVGCKLDDDELNASEAAILLFYYTISAMHVKLHATANWAINMEPKQMKENPFIARNSLVTTIYNYFGFSTFPQFYPAFKALGLVDGDWEPKSWVDTVVHGIKENIVSHSTVSELAPYSDFVNFTCKLRPFFLQEFAKSKAYYFPGCHGEAMYIGTIMHSLDHTRMDWNIEDPLWLDADHPRFGKMAQVGRVVKVGFVSDIPGLLFHRRYKGSGHPFYEKIYERAATINLRLADHMDTCIVK